MQEACEIASAGGQVGVSNGASKGVTTTSKGPGARQGGRQREPLSNLYAVADRRHGLSGIIIPVKSQGFGTTDVICSSQFSAGFPLYSRAWFWGWKNSSMGLATLTFLNMRAATNSCAPLAGKEAYRGLFYAAAPPV